MATISSFEIGGLVEEMSSSSAIESPVVAERIAKEVDKVVRERSRPSTEQVDAFNEAVKQCYDMILQFQKQREEYERLASPLNALVAEQQRILEATGELKRDHVLLNSLLPHLESTAELQNLIADLRCSGSGK